MVFWGRLHSGFFRGFWWEFLPRWFSSEYVWVGGFLWEGLVYAC